MVSVNTHLKVKVRASAITCTAHISNNLPLAYCGAAAYSKT